MDDDAVLTVPETAQRLRTSEETVRRWLRTGKIRGVRLGATRAGWRIPVSEIRRILSPTAVRTPATMATTGNGKP